MTEPLPTPDQHRVRAAEGWLELGNPSEACSELATVSSAQQSHPDVMHLRWQIYRKTKEWDHCLEVAQRLIESAPTDPRAWTAMAQTFYFTQRVQEAYDLATSKISSFPTHWPLYYDAACYACLTGRVPQARQFLQLACAMGNEVEVKLLAEQDPDLAALRQEPS